MPGMVGMALVMRAGNCDQHIRIAAFRHSSRLEPGETVRLVDVGVHPPGHPRAAGHEVVEVHAPAEKGGDGSPIVMDSWADGPAARLENTVWAPYTQTRKTELGLDKRSGTEQRERVEYFESIFGPVQGNSYTKSLLESERDRAAEPSRYIDGPGVQVIDPMFALAARNKLKATTALNREILAAGTAREAYGLTIADATRPSTTATILHEASNLDRQNRPQVTKPTY